MKVSQLLNQDKVTLSFEVFPPKTSSSYESVAHATQEIAALRPDFMSVTYGAGGGTSEHTVNIAADLKKKYDVTVLTHLTCVSSTREHVAAMVKKYKDAGIENILALRGDIPEGGAPHSDYHYAAELVRDIKSQGDFCVGGACYPEGHVEAANKTEDILHLKEKVDAGCEFLTTQMFFDNNIMYNFLYRIREKGITVPVVAGIMPVTNVKQIKRITSKSGTYLPERFKAIVDRFGDNPAAMKQAGVIYATEQIIDLIANGVNHIHVYSMNKPEIAAGIQSGDSQVIELDRSEAIRYMGYHGTQPDEAVQASLTRCGEALQQAAEPKSIYRVFPLQHIDAQTLEIADVQIHSKNLARNLQGCSEVCLMAATLGIGPDRLIARASAVRMSDAVIYQAAAAAMVETYCDEVNERIRQEAAQRGMYCRPRFSPGYGDFPIAHQRDFSRLLDTPRKIGLTVTESCLLAPIKSVTAVIGLSETPQPCHRKGCEECGKTDCAYRR